MFSWTVLDQIVRACLLNRDGAYALISSDLYLKLVTFRLRLEMLTNSANSQGLHIYHPAFSLFGRGFESRSKIQEHFVEDSADRAEAGGETEIDAGVAGQQLGMRDAEAWLVESRMLIACTYDKKLQNLTLH
jgi:hypothetical protein